MKWIMLLLMYPVLPVMIGLLVNEAKPKKNIVIGVTLPFEARQTEEVQAVCRAYRRRLWIAFAALTVAALPSLLFEHASLAFSWQMLWVLAVMIVPFLIYAGAHRRLHALKRVHGWAGESAGRVLVEVQAGALPRRQISFWRFVPPMVAGVVPIVVRLLQPADAAFWVQLSVYLMDALIVVGCNAACRYLYRNRAEVVDEAVDVTLALTRVRRYHWGRFWLAMAYLSGAFAIAMWLLLDISLGLLITACVYAAAVLVLTLRTELAARRAQFKLTQQSGQGVYADDDAHWWLGTVYYNPNDTHTIINNRIGIGSTLNLARPAGKVLMAVCVLCILLIPAMCGWMIAEEFTPIRVSCTEAAVTADHLARVYTVPLDGVVSVALLDTLPGGSKVAGTAIGTLCKGTFRLNGIALCKVCINTGQPLFIRVDTADTVYMFSGNSEEETRSLYGQILAALAQ